MTVSLVSPVVLGCLIVAAFVAGLVDAIAGGGGLIVLPALIAAGLPPSIALATNKGQSGFGMVAATVSYARAGVIDRRRAPIAFAFAAIGSIFGARLQLSMKPDALRPIVAVLLILAVLVMLLKRPPKEPHVLPKHPRAWLAVVTLVLGVYDGFFGPAAGALLIVAFTLLYGDSMVRASANAKVANLGSNIAAVTTFALQGNILWLVALPMAVANGLGATVGAHLATRRGDKFVRVIVMLAVAGAVAKLIHDART